MSAIDVSAVRAYLLDLQDRICAALEGKEADEVKEAGQAGAALDGPSLDGPSLNRPAAFREDLWERSGGGGGRSRVLAGGALLEQGGVGFSHVHGDGLPAAATEKRPELAGRGFEALGVSLVLHPQNPYLPTTHMNVRLLVARRDAADPDPIWWFGGGFDLTPYYPFDEDVRGWHRAAQAACAPFGPEVYPRFKRWCDEYFYLRHRGETRGVGGLFFDDLHDWGFERCFAFLRSVGDAFLPAYLEIVERRRQLPWGERERDFQLYRRGRYVEFNLLYDRGTLFGLQSGGRTESILMSLPPEVRFRYGWHPRPGSPEDLLAGYLTPREWLEDD